jgi:hypothetical protein
MENLRLTRRGLLYFNKRYIIKDIDTNNTIIVIVVAIKYG